MPQPIKKSGTYQKPRSKTVKKSHAPTAKDKRLPEQHKPKRKYTKRPHPEYGTSKLEERFARDFLDKLGIKYVYQFKAESIGRYYDFYVPDYRTLLEIDGDYFHGYGLLYEQMSPMQKKNVRVDDVKNKWASMNGIRLIRIWEHDINNHQESVMEMLKKAFAIKEKKNKILRKKNDTQNIDSSC